MNKLKHYRSVWDEIHIDESMAEKELSVKANFQTTRDKKQMGSNERQKSTLRDPGKKTLSILCLL